MTMKNSLNVFYYDSFVYFSFQVFQLVLTIFLLVYVGFNFQENMYNPIIKTLEMFIAVFMLLDMIFLSIVTEC